MKLLLRIITLISIMGLMGCVASSTQPIRPGITSSVDQNRLRPPSGVRYVYSVKYSEFPETMQMTLVSRRISANRYSYSGHMYLPVESEAVARITASMMNNMFGQQDITARGAGVFFPVRIDTDNRFRSLRVDMLMFSMHFTPHDCFAQLGTCRSTSQDRFIGRLSRVTETTEANGIWRSVTQGTNGRETVQEDNTFSLDQNGVLLDAVMKQTVDGNTQVMTITRVQ